jgi:hypothetical protein
MTKEYTVWTLRWVEKLLCIAVGYKRRPAEVSALVCHSTLASYVVMTLDSSLPLGYLFILYGYEIYYDYRYAQFQCPSPRF